MSSSQVQPLPQGPPSLVEGSRAEGSTDEVLVIALAALTYIKLCGGEDEHGRSLEDAMQAVEGFSLRPRTFFLPEPRGARTRPPRLRVALVPAPCPCPGVPLLVCYSHLARALLVATRARATLCLLLLVRYS